MMQITPTVKQLLIINVLFFIGSQLVPESYTYFSLYAFQDDRFQIWQLITHMFMHANLMHIFFNMFALYSFGSALEHFWGWKKFIFFYLSCGLGAALAQLGIGYIELQYILQDAESLNLSKQTLHQILNAGLSPEMFQSQVTQILQDAGKLGQLTNESVVALYKGAQSVQIPMVGASGAVYGLLVAFAFMFPNAELAMLFIPIPIKAKYFVPAILAIDLFLGVQGSSLFGTGGSGVAHFAHLGGAILGFLMMYYWKRNNMDNRRWN